MPGEPAVDKPPSDAWTTDADKIKHEGDIYYDTDTQNCYRWSYDDETEEHIWVLVADSDLAEALALAQQAKEEAAAAQGTADSAASAASSAQSTADAANSAAGAAQGSADAA
jgi:hypothetical protein